MDSLTKAMVTVVAIVAALYIAWGLFINPAPSNEIPPPQEVGWNHRNYR